MGEEREYQEGERRSLPVSLASAVVSLGSTTATVGSDVIGGLHHLARRSPKRARDDAIMAVRDLAAGMQTTFKLGCGKTISVSPETLNITEDDWQSLHSMTAPLKMWSEYDFPEHMEVRPFSAEDVEVFLKAARVMSVASALSYVDKNDAQKILDAKVEENSDVHEESAVNNCIGVDRWNVEVVDCGTAQAMLLLEMTPPYTRNPFVVLAFRGTELPDDEANGTRQFIPDWWRNLSVELTPYREGGSGGLVAKGFLEAWRGILGGEPGLRPRIMRKLSEYSKHTGRNVDLFITGHSQGGALAAVSLLDLLEEEGVKSLYTVRGCLTLAQPRYSDEAHSDCLYFKLIEKRNSSRRIPFDLVANEDVTGADPVVSLGGASSKALLAGRFWKVRAGEETHGPLTHEEHKNVVEASIPKILWRGMTSVPLHWPGGPHGYLSALEK